MTPPLRCGLLVALLSGCHVLAPYTATTHHDGGADGPAPRDGARQPRDRGELLEGPSDADEGPLADNGGALDRSPPAEQGQGPDGTPADQGAVPDAPPADQGVVADGTPADLAPPLDASAPDQRVIAAACAKKAVAVAIPPQWTTDTMQICEVPGDQCSVANACAQPWHLCTATEYRARGGQLVGNAVRAWLAACIRDGATPVAPVDTTCSSCNTVMGDLLPVQWTCSGAGGNSNFGEAIGIVIDTACHRLGVNDPLTAAFWTYLVTSSTGDGAVCCL